MAAQTIVVPSTYIMSTTAGFRLWGAAISAAIAAVGWVQTADTGQVNWATVTVPGQGVTTVYEIWKAADALQATDPIFLKLIYMISTSVPVGPRIQLIAGTNSDGAGTITSAANTGVSVTSAFEMFNSADNLPAAVAHNSYVNGDTSSLVLFLHPNPNGSSACGGLAVIERRRNVDGTNASGGFQIGTYPSASLSGASINTQTVYTNNLYAQPGASTGTGGPCFVGRGSANAVAQAVRANVVPLFPCFTGAYPEFGGPSKWLLGCYNGDIPLGTTFTVNHYGGTQTFMACGATWLGSGANSGAFSTTNTGYLVPCVRID